MGQRLSLIVMEKLQMVKAFSYIEMVLVLMAVMLLILLAPANRFDFSIYEQDEINAELIALLNYYQTKAIATKSVIYVSFPPGSDTIFIKSSQLSLDYHYKIKNGMIDKRNNTTNTQFYFDGHGINKGGTVHYRINQTHYKIIFQLQWGRIRIEKL